jgi:hypothetical protein
MTTVRVSPCPLPPLDPAFSFREPVASAVQTRRRTHNATTEAKEK